MKLIRAVSILGLLGFASPLPAADGEPQLRESIQQFYKEWDAHGAKGSATKDSVVNDKGVKNPEDAALLDFVDRSPFVTSGFKQAMRKLVNKLRKKDPEMGLDYDPFLCAQDDPPGGIKIDKIAFAGDTATITMCAKDDPANFRFKVKAIKRDGKWLINGIGRDGSFIEGKVGK